MNHRYFWFGHKVPDHTQVHIRLQKGGAYIVHGFLDVFFRQDALAAKLFENGFQSVGQILKHGIPETKDTCGGMQAILPITI